MKEWNERRLDDFFRMNFDKGTCKREISGEEMTVTDNEGERLKFVIRENRIFSPDTNQFYAG